MQIIVEHKRRLNGQTRYQFVLQEERQDKTLLRHLPVECVVEYLRMVNFVRKARRKHLSSRLVRAEYLSARE